MKTLKIANLTCRSFMEIIWNSFYKEIIILQVHVNIVFENYNLEGLQRLKVEQAVMILTAIFE